MLYHEVDSSYLFNAGLQDLYLFPYYACFHDVRDMHYNDANMYCTALTLELDIYTHIYKYMLFVKNRYIYN